VTDSPAATAPILVLGEALVDVVRRPDGSVAEHPGGSPANVAIGLARLGHEVAFATRLGDDPYGAVITEHLTESAVRLVNGPDDHRTSSAQATIGPDGGATYVFDLHWDLPPVELAEATHVHTGSIAAVLEPGAAVVAAALKAARGTATVSYDPNARPALMGAPEPTRRHIEELIAFSDVVKASDEDIAWLYPGRAIGEVLRHWGRLGPALALATRGGAGVTVYLAATGAMQDLPVSPVEVVDTVGAGDSFMSGLLSGLLDAGLLGGVAARDRLAQAGEEEVRPAVDRALACSRITVSRAGANPPTRAELP
jgi:fructokinase